MFVVVRLIALPSLFILPWLLMKLGNKETLVQQTLTHQPLLAVALLLPGLLLFLWWMLRGVLRRG